jgi:phosphomannomutase
MMTVSGVRGIVGETLTENTCALLAYFQTMRAGGGPVVVGRDTRPSGEALARAIFRGIRLAGGEPIDIGISPTPTTCFSVKHFGASAGVIITASHNPNPYNGYKMVHRDGRLFTGAECEDIYQLFRGADRPDSEALRGQPAEAAQQRDPVAPHVRAICDAVDTGLIRRAGVTVAIDAINGAGARVFPALLDALGVDWKGVFIEQSGDFAHNPEPRPEHLHELAALLKSDDSFWGGFAFDPDADRLAPMGENGEPISEEMTLALALTNALAKEKSDIATNLSTSMVVDDVAKSFGVLVHRTKIGEAHVVQGMHEHDCLVGGEGNGGVIYPRIATVRDGLTALALIIEQMARTGRKLTALAGEWQQYPLVKEKITLRDRPAAEVIEQLSADFASETIDRQDGLKIVRPDGWVHVRASNTEPILRCYAEGRTEQQARELAEMVTARIARAS